MLKIYKMITELNDIDINKNIKKLRSEIKRTQIVTILLALILIMLSMLVIQN